MMYAEHQDNQIFEVYLLSKITTNYEFTKTTVEPKVNTHFTWNINLALSIHVQTHQQIVTGEMLVLIHSGHWSVCCVEKLTNI